MHILAALTKSHTLRDKVTMYETQERGLLNPEMAGKSAGICHCKAYSISNDILLALILISFSPQSIELFWKQSLDKNCNRYEIFSIEGHDVFANFEFIAKWNTLGCWSLSRVCRDADLRELANVIPWEARVPSTAFHI